MCRSRFDLCLYRDTPDQALSVSGAERPVNILFLTQRVPYPPDRGDRIATYNYLRHMWDRGDRVRVGCLSQSDRDADGIAFLEERCVAVCAPRVNERVRKIASLRGVLTGQPLTVPYFSNARLRRSIRDWVREDPPDLVFIYSSSMAQYVMDLEAPIRIMYFAELDSDKWRQYAEHRSFGPGKWIYGREARLLLEFERRIARSFDASAVVSEVEKELFLKRIPDVTPHVIPNGVDVEFFTSEGHDNRHPHTAVFTGVMDYEPNHDGMLWFCAEAWPLVRREIPDAELLIVGNRPTKEIQALDGQNGVTVTGWVDKTQPYFDKSSVAIAPLRLARGLQNKVLEAMSMELPVVATHHAAQGLGDVPADTLIVEDSMQKTAEILIRLFRDNDEARAIGARAAEFVRSHFRWKHTNQKLDVLLETKRER